MKTVNLKLMAILTLFIAVGFVVSCSDDDKGNDKEVTRTELEASIAEAENLLATTEEGTLEGQYIVNSKAPLQTTVADAKIILADENQDQTAINNTNTNVQVAITTYKGKFVKAIAATDLIAQWKFDDGEGTTALDYSGNSHSGTFEAGHAAAGGGGVPTWTTDRRGDANKALHFTKGAHIVVPDHADFGPSEMTISVWVKVDSLNLTACGDFEDRCSNGKFKDNFIISNNGYKGYKFQTQDDLYPFFTVNSGVEGPYIDKASTTPIKMKGWYHLVVTFKTNSMRFYIDGVDVTKPVPGDGAFTGGFGAFTRKDIAIGQETKNADVPSDISWVLAHFEGSMDELKVYKKALDATQVGQIYNQEKP